MESPYVVLLCELAARLTDSLRLRRRTLLRFAETDRFLTLPRFAAVSLRART